MKVIEIEIKKIKGNPYQTRIYIQEGPLKILTKSIREQGLFNPITILKESEEEYIVVHGHRRLAAYKKLRRKTIPAFIKSRDQKKSLITDLIHENLIREDLTVQEKALTIKLLFSQIKSLNGDLDQIISCISGGKMYKQRGIPKTEGKGAGRRKTTKWSDDDMFQGMKYLKEIGMSENNAISYLSVLRLPTQIQKIVRFNVHNDQGESSFKRISIRMAVSLARVDDKGYQNYLLGRALGGTTARHIAALVSNYKLKVLKGEWKGHVRKFNNSGVLKNLNEGLFLELSDRCGQLSRKLNTFKATKVKALSEILEKDIFIASTIELRKEIMLLDQQLKKINEDKGYKKVEDIKFNEVFEIPVKLECKKKMVRGTIPRKMLRKMGVRDDQLKKGTFFQVKIVGIK